MELNSTCGEDKNLHRESMVFKEKVAYQVSRVLKCEIRDVAC